MSDQCSKLDVCVYRYGVTYLASTYLYWFVLKVLGLLFFGSFTFCDSVPFIHGDGVPIAGLIITSPLWLPLALTLPAVMGEWTISYVVENLGDSFHNVLVEWAAFLIAFGICYYCVLLIQRLNANGKSALHSYNVNRLLWSLVVTVLLVLAFICMYAFYPGSGYTSPRLNDSSPLKTTGEQSRPRTGLHIERGANGEIVKLCYLEDGVPNGQMVVNTNEEGNSWWIMSKGVKSENGVLTQKDSKGFLVSYGQCKDSKPLNGMFLLWRKGREKICFFLGGKEVTHKTYLDSVDEDFSLPNPWMEASIRGLKLPKPY